MYLINSLNGFLVWGAFDALNTLKIKKKKRVWRAFDAFFGYHFPVGKIDRKIHF